MQVVTLGCRLNIAESEQIAALLHGGDNVVVVNSCAVTAEALRHTRQAIRRARRQAPSARLLVTGCAVETDRAALAAMPEVDGLVANEAKLDPRAWNAPARPSGIAPRTRTRAFLAVQNGCDHSCTFCIIPRGRGRSRSLPIDAVLQDARHAIERGAQELVLTGVDLTSWGQDLAPGVRLGSLVEAILDAFPQLPRLRLSSLDGIEIDALLFALITQEKRVMPHVHLSLQHGADLILKRMKRRHLRRDAVRLMERLRAHRPEIALGADLIAGFPTETETHHQANLSLIEELELVHGHVFPFSPRPGTPAALMPQIPPARVKERAAELRGAVADRHRHWQEGLLGRPLDVLAEHGGTGRSPQFARVALPSGTPPGAIVSLTPSRLDNGLLK